MAKVKTVFFCSSCGNESVKWLGQCPSCKEWNTLQEEVIQKGPPAAQRVKDNQKHAPTPLQSIPLQTDQRIVLPD
ncbi:MAG: DNA repair protein RadA, partial [Flavobacteriales bacterium]|nr:DNA repair protein RadA [Flavobacteriales bacterium]